MVLADTKLFSIISKQVNKSKQLGVIFSPLKFIIIIVVNINNSFIVEIDVWTIEQTP